jgi:hypothetical protein
MLHVIRQRFAVVLEPQAGHRCLYQCLCAVPVIALIWARVQQEVENWKLGAGQQYYNYYLPSIWKDGVMQAYTP